MATQVHLPQSETSKLFVLINCVGGKIGATMDKIRKIKTVTDVQQIDGQYDIIVTLESKSSDELKKILMHQIRTIDTIVCTLTLRSNLDAVFG